MLWEVTYFEFDMNSLTLFYKSSDASRIIVVMLILMCWRFGQKMVSTKCMLTLCGSLSNWKITLQSIVVLSIIEAKYMGITKIVKKKKIKCLVDDLDLQ